MARYTVRMARPQRIELIRGLHNLRESHRGCALTVGKFDGVHRGHQALLERTREAADADGVPATVLSFDPSPREFFAGGRRLPRISTLRDKLSALQSCGVQRLVLARFDQEMADTTAGQFVEDVLVRQLGIRSIVVGDDLHFGRNRAGDTDYLRSRADELSYRVIAVDTVTVAEQRCSSSLVRETLAEKDFKLAERLLGRPYAVTGRVRRGLQVGRQLDMPTANIPVLEPLAIPLGVYAVHAVVGHRTYPGVASLGIRPTLGLTQCLLETHLFDVELDLYGQLLSVEFQHYLRPELRFDSMEALREQMHRDASQARQLLQL